MVVAYWGTGLSQAIGAYALAHKVAPALRHYLSGCTKPTYHDWGQDRELEDYGGFVSEFEGALPADLRRKLVRPDKS